MKCCENFIVTLRLGPGGNEIDMELASFMPIDELCGKIAESLRAMNPVAFSSVVGISMAHENKTLDSSATLASAGLWDGSILDITFEKRGIA